MKKMLTVAAIAAFAALAVSCNNKKARPIAAIEAYSDSIYMVNDSTIGDLQTFVYEGVMPSDAGMPANYVLAISSYGLNSDGTYTLTESYTETNGKVNTNFDEGEKIVLNTVSVDTQGLNGGAGRSQGGGGTVQIQRFFLFTATTDNSHNVPRFGIHNHHGNLG